MDIHIRAELNSFATRSFRDIADQDYIAARLSYKYDLVSQFHWQSLQALEKYFKAIFFYNKIEEKGINHNIENAISMLMLQMMGAFAEFERSLIRERQREGIELAKKNGKKLGRKSSLSSEQITEVKDLVTLGLFKSKIAGKFNVSRQTIYNVI